MKLGLKGVSQVVDIVLILLTLERSVLPLIYLSHSDI